LLGLGQSSSGALSGQAGLELGDGNHLGHEEPAHSPGRDLWQITEDNVDTCIEERQKKFRVPCKPVELRDDQSALELPAKGERGYELWSVAPPAALDLDKFTREYPTAPVQKVCDGLALCLNSPASLALAVGRNPEITDPLSAVLTQRGRVIAAYALLGATGRLDVKTLGLNTPDYSPEAHYQQVWVPGADCARHRRHPTVPLGCNRFATVLRDSGRAHSTILSVSVV
jgi:hypothetical protein